jgi:hypothetical protein
MHIGQSLLTLLVIATTSGVLAAPTGTGEIVQRDALPDASPNAVAQEPPLTEEEIEILIGEVTGYLQLDHLFLM